MGYASWFLPIVLVTWGWHYFWCQQVEAVYTKAIGLVLTLGCTASFLNLAFGVFEGSGRTFPPGGYLGRWLAEFLAEYLNRTGSIIVVLTFLFLALILTTQLSFGLIFSATGAMIIRASASSKRALRSWLAERRREHERQEVLEKHLSRKGASSA